MLCTLSACTLIFLKFLRVLTKKHVGPLDFFSAGKNFEYLVHRGVWILAEGEGSEDLVHRGVWILVQNPNKIPKTISRQVSTN